jgi:uncharacterized membrane protein YdjX (TVP38/TMEM64 family)
MDLKIDKHLAMDIGRVVFLVVFFTAMAIYLGRPEIRERLFSIHNLRIVLHGGHGESFRLYPALLFTIIWGGLIAAGVPRLWASAVGGIIYGAFMGAILSLIASLLGAIILYGAGFSFLYGVMERRVGGTLKVWKERFQENAFWWVLYGRLFPFSNSTLMSLLCGSCRVSYRGFMLGSLLGFIPLAVVFATYGSGGVEGNLWQITVATVLLVLSVFSRKLFGKWFPATVRNSH